MARTFVELLEGGRFEIGVIGTEWIYGEKKLRPDLAIHDTGEPCRMFVENKVRRGADPWDSQSTI